MRRAPTASGLSRLLPTQRQPAAPDAAEMGTAYGLEMTLETTRANATTAEAAKAQAAPAKAPGGKKWLARLRRR